jgi:hypothetical protein
MDADFSEGLFASYLDVLQLNYQRHVPVAMLAILTFASKETHPFSAT